MTVLTSVLRDVVQVGSEFIGKKREGAAATLRFVAHRNRLKVSSIGHDSQMLTQEIECECPRDLEVLIPPKRFGQILASIKDEKITITEHNGSVKIKGASCQFTLATEKPQDFPAIDEIVSDYSEVAIPVAALLSSLQHCLPFCDDHSTRFALGGVLFEFSADGTRIVATDSRRMMVSNRPDVKITAGPVKFILPSAIGKSIVSLLRRQGGDLVVNLQVNLTRMLLIGDGFRLVTPAVQGRFPEWRSVMSAQNSSLVLSATVAALKRSCRLAGVMTSEEHRGIVFRVGEKVEISSSNEVGDSAVQLEAEIKSEIVTELVASYMLDAVAGFEDHEIVEWRQQGSDEAMFLHLPDEMTCLIMPLSPDR